MCRASTCGFAGNIARAMISLAIETISGACGSKGITLDSIAQMSEVDRLVRGRLTWVSSRAVRCKRLPVRYRHTLYRSRARRCSGQSGPGPQLVSPRAEIFGMPAGGKAISTCAFSGELKPLKHRGTKSTEEEVRRGSVPPVFLSQLKIEDTFASNGGGQ